VVGGGFTAGGGVCAWPSALKVINATTQNVRRPNLTVQFFMAQKIRLLR
jgi:hypothetical protein